MAMLGLAGCGRRNTAEVARTLAAPVEKILLRRTACFGRCPVYTVSFCRDGRAELQAEAHLSRRGSFTGRIEAAAFAELSERIGNGKFDRFAPRYDAAYTDAPSCTVTVLRADGAGSSVYEYGSEGPDGLHVIQKAIDAARDGIDWQPVK
ncbi:hypothetical protein llg_20650 [Luteolibacter sp. LG18]|nr:hypothetical protein llg_20650 [Luteolibacter sp. LG18]